ncbi:MAG: hypothetical protein HOG25_02230 [Gammaproteobacteria bacterium]|nr:hypothetical protein [Gammaproteobacteria bacterium]
MATSTIATMLRTTVRWQCVAAPGVAAPGMARCKAPAPGEEPTKIQKKTKDDVENTVDE